MTSLLLQLDRMLRPPTIGASFSLSPARLVSVSVACGLIYGALMGTFGGVTGERALQLFYSALKTPMLLLVTFFISLPSFFVLNTLLGLRSDFPEVLQAQLKAQTSLTLVLLAMAPYTLLCYASFDDYNGALLFNALVFATASFAGQWHLRRSCRPLIQRNPRHRLMLRAWLGIYVFVGIQMAWVLRPFVGHPNMRIQFFREEAWGNAYVELAQKIWNVWRTLLG